MVAVVVAVVVVAAPVVALEELAQEHSARQVWALLEEEEEAVQRAPLALVQEGREQCPQRLPHSPPP